MKKKLAVAARGLGDRFTGAQKYIYHFIHELIQHQDLFEVHLYYNDPVHLTLFPQAKQHYLPCKNRLIWDHILLPLALRKDEIDITIFPKGTKSLFSSTKDVVIMLDLGYFYKSLNAYTFLDTIYMKAMMRYAAKRAWKILSISASTKRDVVRILSVPESKVEVIYAGCDDVYQPASNIVELERVKQKYGLQPPFIFYPTSISPRKNLMRLLDAFDLIKDKIPHQLYLTGSTGWNSFDVFERLKNPSYDFVHLLGKVNETDMPYIYALADFTVYISLFEGFGLPVLEAMACGSPVLASDQTSIPEVAGQAALVVDAFSAEEIARGLVTLAQDEDLRDRYRAAGLLQAKEFSWKRVVETALIFISTD